MDGIARVVKSEAGGPIFHDPATSDHEIEPFGFRDQISTPMDPNLVFSAEPRDPASNFGCFAAFMKLEQNTEQFRKLCRDFSDLLGSMHVFVSPEEIAARVVGRFRTGEPLIPKGPAGLDDFNFSSDPEGAACPYQSHIRVMNPRDGRRAAPSCAAESFIRMGNRRRTSGRTAATRVRSVIFGVLSQPV